MPMPSLSAPAVAATGPFIRQMEQLQRRRSTHPFGKSKVNWTAPQ
jgi:hypothetical protein